MERHPGIVFRSAPAGRRAGLASGPDVWEVVRVCLASDADGPLTPERIAEQMGLTADQIRVVLRYYAEYTAEVDDWLRCVDEEAERAEAAWRCEQGLLGG